MPRDINVLVGRRVELYLDARGDAFDKVGFFLTKAQTHLMETAPGDIIELRNQDFDFTKIDGRYSKIDAVLIQSRGSKPRDENGAEAECERCASGKGPFKGCVRLVDYAGGGGCCGNCRWHDQASLCDFYYDGESYIRVSSQSPDKTVSTKSGREVKKPERQGIVTHIEVPEFWELARGRTDSKVAKTRHHRSRRGVMRRGGNVGSAVPSQRLFADQTEDDPEMKVELD